MTAAFVSPYLPDGLQEEMVNIRRYLHKNPELSFKEVRAAGEVLGRLAELESYEVRRRVGGGYGVVADLKGTRAGPCIAFRADMDALPIQDTLQTEYRSEVPNVKHACGHDGHVAMLLGFAKAILPYRAKLPGPIRLLFQPAEERGAGALPMIQAGCLDGVAEVYSGHLWSPKPVGWVGARNGPTMAGVDMYRITIKGPGGHGAQPHRALNPITVGAQLLDRFRAIVAEGVDPACPLVITPGFFHAGQAENIIPKEAELGGTIRSYDEATRQAAMRRIERAITGVWTETDAVIDISYPVSLPATVNDPAAAGRVRAAAERLGAATDADIYLTVSEDASYYLKRRPGCHFFIGSAPASGPVEHHTPEFDIDERALSVGASLWLELALGER